MAFTAQDVKTLREKNRLWYDGLQEGSHTG